MTIEEFKQKGGAWLGAARSWIQWNCKNGESVIWSSSDPLNRKNHGFTMLAQGSLRLQPLVVDRSGCGRDCRQSCFCGNRRIQTKS